MNHKLLMIPGPIEFDPLVSEAVGEATLSHVDPVFIESFGNSLEMMRKVWQSPDGQPFILAGSGTLGMDTAACNLVEAGDSVLVLSTGYFGERYSALLERYGAKVDVLRSSTGQTSDEEEVEKYLSAKVGKEVIIEADAGAEIASSIRESCIIALQEKRDVRLNNNGKKYKISPFDIVDSIFTQNNG